MEAPAWASGGLRPVGPNLYLDQLNGWQLSLVECDFTVENPQPKVLWTRQEIHEAITPPVIAGGRLFLRTPVELICFDLRDR